jgi:hypothetical protein
MVFYSEALSKRMFDNNEVAIKNEQARETGNTRRRKTQQNHNAYVGHHYAQTNTNNLNKTGPLLQTTEGKDEQNILFMI